MDEQELAISEIYPSIQGESGFVGLPTAFIRLAGCNLRCSWCDSTYTFKKGQKRTIKAIIDKVEEFALSYVCVTGGEPLLQKNLPPLIKKLCDMEYTVSIETSGSLPINNIDPRAITIMDIKCPSSGMSEKNRMANLASLRPRDEVKFVIADRRDFLFAVEVCQKEKLFSRRSKPLFSCVHDLLEPRILAKWILEKRVTARLNLQTHKFIWPSAARGV